MWLLLGYKSVQNPDVRASSEYFRPTLGYLKHPGNSTTAIDLKLLVGM